MATALNWLPLTLSRFLSGILRTASDRRAFEFSPCGKPCRSTRFPFPLLTLDSRAVREEALVACEESCAAAREGAFGTGDSRLPLQEWRAGLIADAGRVERGRAALKIPARRFHASRSALQAEGGYRHSG